MSPDHVTLVDHVTSVTDINIVTCVTDINIVTSVTDINIVTCVTDIVTCVTNVTLAVDHVTPIAGSVTVGTDPEWDSYWYTTRPRQGGAYSSFDFLMTLNLNNRPLIVSHRSQLRCSRHCQSK